MFHFWILGLLTQTNVLHHHNLERNHCLIKQTRLYPHLVPWHGDTLGLVYERTLAKLERDNSATIDHDVKPSVGAGEGEAGTRSG